MAASLYGLSNERFFADYIRTRRLKLDPLHQLNLAVVVKIGEADGFLLSRHQYWKRFW